MDYVYAIKVAKTNLRECFKTSNVDGILDVFSFACWKVRARALSVINYKRELTC
jgi:hypothetical protein